MAETAKVAEMSQAAKQHLEGLPREAAPLVRAEAPTGPGGLALGPERIVWTRERVELIKTQICPTGVSDDEFAIFIEQAKRAAMDPLMGECFCVPRRVKIGDDRDGRWVTKHVFQPGEAGMEARADRFPDYRGIRAAAVYAKDKCEIDPFAGTVAHSFSPVGDRGLLVGAWAIVMREGRVLPVAFVRLEERIQTTKEGRPTATWLKPETMIVKCARAAALRLAYPNTFGGLFIEGEVPGAEEREVNAPPATAEQERNGGRTRTERVAEKVAQRAGASTVLPPPAGGAVLALFGPQGVKGMALSSLSGAALEDLLREGEAKVAESPGAKWAAAVGANLDAIAAELKARAAELAKPQPEDAETVPAAPRPPSGDDGVPF